MGDRTGTPGAVGHLLFFFQSFCKYYTTLLIIIPFHSSPFIIHDASHNPIYLSFLPFAFLVCMHACIGCILSFFPFFFFTPWVVACACSSTMYASPTPTLSCCSPSPSRFLHSRSHFMVCAAHSVSLSCLLLCQCNHSSRTVSCGCICGHLLVTDENEGRNQAMMVWWVCNYKKQMRSRSFRQRSYHCECTGSRPITEVKRSRAGLVLWWVTAREHLVLLATSFFFFQSFCSITLLCSSSFHSIHHHSSFMMLHTILFIFPFCLLPFWFACTHASDAFFPSSLFSSSHPEW